MSFRCVSCNSPIAIDPSLLERYPEMRRTNILCCLLPDTSISLGGGGACSNASSRVPGSSMIVSVRGSGSPDACGCLSAGGSAAKSDCSLGVRSVQAANLMDMVSEDQLAIDHPMCQSCADRLLDLMDQNLHHLEEECREYKQLLDRLKLNPERNDPISLKEKLANMKNEEKAMYEELLRLEEEEKLLDEQISEESAQFQKEVDEEESLWHSYRNFRRQITELDADIESVHNQYIYTKQQLEKLEKTNVFNLAFHIWHSGHFGTINGFRLGRLPNEMVEWWEINAAWGQVVLLLHSLAKKVSFRFERYQLVPYGSYSYIKCLDDGKELKLFTEGGAKFTWNPKFDQAIIAFLDCLQQFEGYIKRTVGTDYHLPYKMYRDKIEDAGNEYYVKTHLNSEERWTKAMKCMLTNLKWALAWVSSLS